MISSIRLICLSGLLGALLSSAGPVFGADGKKYALLVGVTEYDHASLAPLKYTENDVEELARLLQRRTAGFDTVNVLTVSRGKTHRKAPIAANV
jgi:hypothetical protein